MPSSLIADDEVRAKLVSMDRLFETMSETKSFWTDEAVSTGAEWQQLRQRARDVLAYLKQPLEAPRLTWLTYVQSG